MHPSMAEILEVYACRLGSKDPGSYLFEGRGKKPRSQTWAYSWFRRALSEAGTVYEKEKGERAGPCPCSMRHTFIQMAYMQYSGASAQPFESVMPFLPAYAGHVDIKGTDRYFGFDPSLHEEDNGRIDTLMDAMMGGWHEKNTDAAIGRVFPLHLPPRGERAEREHCAVVLLRFPAPVRVHGLTLGKETGAIELGDFKEDTLRIFLASLESGRASSVSTRNQRLSALRAFSSYLERRRYAVSHAHRLSAKSAEVEKAPEAAFAYFTQEEIKAILALPFPPSSLGQRQRVQGRAVRQGRKSEGCADFAGLRLIVREIYGKPGLGQGRVWGAPPIFKPDARAHVPIMRHCSCRQVCGASEKSPSFALS